MTKTRAPLDILNYTVTGNQYVVVVPAEYGHGIDGWKIVAECSSGFSARCEAAAANGSRVYFRRVDKPGTWARMAKN